MSYSDGLSSLSCKVSDNHYLAGSTDHSKLAHFCRLSLVWVQMYRNLKRFLETSNLGLNSQSIIACQIHGHYSDEDTTRMYKQTHTPTAGQEENEGRGWGEVFDTQ